MLIKSNLNIKLGDKKKGRKPAKEEVHLQFREVILQHTLWVGDLILKFNCIGLEHIGIQRSLICVLKCSKFSECFQILHWIIFFFSTVVLLCCFMKCRVPRTKQEIEADFKRKEITRRFRFLLDRVQVEDTSLRTGMLFKYLM